MAALVKYDHGTKYAEFSIDSAAELELLPTTTAAGSVSGLAGAVAAGSAAYLTDGTLGIYTLDGSGTWNAVN